MNPSSPASPGDSRESEGEAAPRVPRRAGADLPSELLSRIWQQNLPLMRERVAVLEDTVRLVGLGTLSPTARTHAADLAHKFAGSLGMFGFPQGTELAREMELMLEDDAPPDAHHLSGLVAQLRSLLSL